MQVKKYSPEDSKLWDKFVRESKNGNFHLERGFINYHDDRFADHSLIVFDENEPVALMPGNRIDKNYYSHSGLTYGGFLILPSCRMTQFIGIAEVVFDYLKANGFDKLIYKTIPYIYHQLPSEEDRHALFIAGAKVIKRDILPVLDMRNRPEYQERRKRSIKKALNNNVLVKETPDLGSYWEIIDKLLLSYGTKPVHSLADMNYLKTNFPENIRLFAACNNEEMIAGVLVFESVMVARSQYIAATETGKNSGALDLIFNHLFNNIYQNKRYFDFGTSTTYGGYKLNPGISDQKEGFGARSIVQDTYELDLSKWESGKYNSVIK